MNNTMIYKNLDNGGEIHTWFPKSIYYKKILENDLTQIEKYLKSLKYNMRRTSEFEVESSYTVNENLLHKNTNLKSVFNEILKSAKQYSKELGYDNHYSKKLKIESSWFNISNSGDYLQRHTHPNSFLSGVFYVKCGNEDYIRFYEDDMLATPKFVNELSHTNTNYICQPGVLLIFKSNLPHSTNKQISSEKIAISFNIK